MDSTRPARTVELGEMCLLAYAEHMAETSRTKSAKRMFEQYVKYERGRLGVNDRPRDVETAIGALQAQSLSV